MLKTFIKKRKQYDFFALKAVKFSKFIPSKLKKTSPELSKKVGFIKPRFSKAKLAVFMLVFAASGAYLIFNSYAATNAATNPTAFNDPMDGTSIAQGPNQWTVVDNTVANSNSYNCVSAANAAETGGFLTETITQGSYTCSGTTADGWHGTCNPDPGTCSSSWRGAEVQARDQAFKYGTLQVTAKVAGGLGNTWPSLWLNGVGAQHPQFLLQGGGPQPCGVNGWPNSTPPCEEADIFDWYGGTYGAISSNLYDAATGANGKNCSGGNMNPTAEAAFHTYKLVWSASSFVVSIDGATACTFTSQLPVSLMFPIMDVEKSQNVGTAPQTSYFQNFSIVPAGPDITSSANWPAISGSTATGSVLTASTGTWTGSPSAYHYQWLRCNSSGAVCSVIQTGSCTSAWMSCGNTYTTVAADAGHDIQVLVQADNGSGSTQYGSNVTGTIGGGGGAPTVTLSANPTSITSGSSSTLTWSSTNATSCSATTPAGWTSSTAISGTQSVSPVATTTYTITCTGAGGSTPASTTVTIAGGLGFDHNLGSGHWNSLPGNQSFTTTAAASSATRVVVNVSYWASTGSVSSVSVGGAAAHLDKQTINPNGHDIYEVWSIPEPTGLASGSTIAANFPGVTGGSFLSAMSLSGVDLTNGGGITATASANGSGTSFASGTVSSPGGIVVGGAGNETVASTTATDSSGTKVHDVWDSGAQQGFTDGYNIGGTSIAGTFSTSSTATTGAAVAYSAAAGDTQAPTASITAPANGATVTGTQAVTVTASDDTGVTKVEWYVDGALQGSKTTSPYSFSWNTVSLSNGTHQLVAKAYDAAGNVGTSAPVTVTTSNDTTAPSIPTGVVASSGGMTQVNVSWNAATDDVGVTGYHIFRNGTQVATTTNTSFTDTGLSSGVSYSYTVTAFDAAGNESAQSAAASATTDSDTTPPTTPAGLTQTGSTASTAAVSWSPSTDNVGVAGYDYYNGGMLPLGTTTSTNVTFTGLSCGTSYTIGIDAYDAAGNRSPQATTVVITAACDTTPPTASISAPADGSTVSGTIAVSANSSDNVGVVGVQFKLDGANLGSEDTTSPYSINWDTTTVSNGSHTLTATARDAAGNSTTSSTVTVTVNNVAAITLDKKVTTHQSAKSTSISSPSLTTSQSNELLVAFITSDGPIGSQSFSSVTGGGLTWTLQKRVNTQPGTSEIWTAPATSIVSSAIIKATRASGSYNGSITVAAFLNANLTTIGAVGGASATSGAPSASLTATQTGSILWGVGNDYDNATARTVGSGQTLVDQYLATTGDTYWVQSKNANNTAGQNVTLNDTAPTTDRWNLAIIEILTR